MLFFRTISIYICLENRFGRSSIFTLRVNTENLCEKDQIKIIFGYICSIEEKEKIWILENKGFKYNIYMH
jgi:hypothetical protein